MLEFLVLSFCNIALLCWLMKRQGITSVEGYCALFVGMDVLTDNIQLLFDYYFRPGILPLGANEVAFRSYPTFVHIIGLLVLIAGLFLGNPKPLSISRQSLPAELEFVAHTGRVLLIIGLVLAAIAVYLTHSFSAVNFFHTLDTMRSGEAGQTTGGFFYRGADIAIFGLALILPSVRNMRRFVLVLVSMLAISFFLRANKGGFETPILWAAMALYTYNPRRLFSLVKPRIMSACLLIALLGIGVKVQLLSVDGGSLSFQRFTDGTVGAMATRWGDNGIYRGYCQFVNTLPIHEDLFKDYSVAKFVLTAWIPRAINQSKQAQPTKGLGFMVHADAHTYEDETPAIGLVGSVYADNGFYSLAAYMLIIGFLLGLLRRYTASRRSALQWHIFYLNFALFGGLSPESGIFGILYVLLLALSVTGLAHLVVLGMFMRKRRLIGGRGESVPRLLDLRQTGAHPWSSRA